MSKAADNSDLPTRVTVLEHTVGAVKSGLDTHRDESRAAFQKVQEGIDSLVKSTAAAAATAQAAVGQKTNWFAVMGFVGAAIAAISAVFSLAEWRVGVATTPLVNLPQQMIELRVQLERDRAVQQYKDKLSAPR